MVFSTAHARKLTKILVLVKLKTNSFITLSTLYVIVKSEFTNRMFSGFRSVWVNLFSCKTANKEKQNKSAYS